jgi:hypothetical protein
MRAGGIDQISRLGLTPADIVFFQAAGIRPVKNLPGNRSIIQDGVDGFLYDTVAASGARAETLLTQPASRAGLGRQAWRKIATQSRLEGEIGGHLALYRALLGRAEP